MARSFIPLGLVVCLITLCPGAKAAPVESGLLPIVHLDAPPPPRGAPAGILGTAGQDTTYLGGTTWDPVDQRWEALPDSMWTFDTGVASSFTSTVDGGIPVDHNPFKQSGLHRIMEGWTGFDNSFNGTNPYFRWLEDGDPAWTEGPGACVGSGVDPSWGRASFWCGVGHTEAPPLCYTDYQGYGNSWSVAVERVLEIPAGGAPLELRYDYRANTEPAYDYVYVHIDTTGSGGDLIELARYSGAVGPATEILDLQPGVDLRSTPGPVRLVFRVESDGAYSDEDGLYPTGCGAFAFDNLILSGAVTDTCDFEEDAGGFALVPPEPGPGGEWADIVAVSDLPPPQTDCTCPLEDSVLVFADHTVGTGGHGLFQDNLAASPWIDLDEHGLTGAPGKMLETSFYSELSLLDYVFLQFNIQWYPQVCNVTGELITSPFTSNGFIFYGQLPRCVPSLGGGSYGVEFSDIVDPAASRIRVAVGVISYCRFFGNCSGVTNTAPWFDNIRLGVYGEPRTPFLDASGVDLPMDSFPQNGTLRLDAPGRVDCNNVKGYSSPEPFSSLGDTLVVSGGLPGRGNNAGAEVYVTFSVRPGPGDDGALPTWASSHTDLPAFPWLTDGHGQPLTWYSARMDTSKQGSVNNNASWMTAYHEESALFSGSDLDTDPNDPDPLGNAGRKANDIFPDGGAGLFVPGTRLNLFYQARYVDDAGVPTTGEFFTFPDTSGGRFLEMEVLPSSASADSTWNCILYVDHFDGWGAQGPIEAALGNVVGGGSANFENVPWDRWDVRAPSSHQASFGRPLGSDYGATLAQALAYRMILWNSGNLSAFNLTDEDADVLRPWLTFPQGGPRGLYLSGNGVAHSMTAEGMSEPNARRLLEDDMGVQLACDSIREAGCNGSGADLTGDCVRLSPFGGPGNNGDAAYWGLGCPGYRDFDRVTPVPGGVAVGDETYRSDGVSSAFASVGNERSGPGAYRTMLDGGSLHYRAATSCDPAAGPAAIVDRLGRVLEWMGFAGAAQACGDLSTPLDVGGEPAPWVAPTLAAARPNPARGGPVRLSGSAPAGRLRVVICDVGGRQVRTLLDEPVPGGMFETLWDGRDKHGTRVASGVYFARMEAAGSVLTRKLVVIGR